MGSTTVGFLALQVLFRVWDPSSISPQTEIAFWSVLKGVDPHLALAVAATETGDLPEKDGRRDRAVYVGNYGRFQIRCKTWRDVLGLKQCDELLDRHLNIRAGVTILSYVQAMFAPRNLAATPFWVSHWNEGIEVEPGGQGERFARAVIGRMRREQLASMRRWGTWKGW